MANLDFGADWGKSALNNFSNGHYGLGAIQLVNGMGEAALDLLAAYFGASAVGATTSAVGTTIAEKSITAGYVDFEFKLGSYISNLENKVSNISNNVKGSVIQGINDIKRGASNLFARFSPVKSPAQQAMAWQGQGDYPGIDNWTDVVLKEGSYVWGEAPGQTSFYTTTADIMAKGNDATKIFQGVQVGIPEGYNSYRPGMTMYRVPYDMNVAISQALANPQHGEGGMTQLFIPEYKKLEPVQTLILSNR